MNQQISTGYIYKEHLPEHEAKLGDVWPVINPSGQWNTTPPQDEEQDIGVEPMCCTSEGNKGAVETLTRFLFNDTTILSARLLAYLSGTTRDGNDPMTVADTLATKGTVPESDWPNTSDLKTWDEFYAVPPQAIVTEALEFPAQYFLEKRWIGTDPASLKSGLTISSTGVAGYAWAMDNNGLYYTPAGAQPCHWFFLIGYELDETQPNGVKWIIFDSYEKDIKYLRGDYVFSEAMQYRITKNVGNTPTEQAWYQVFLSWMSDVINKMRYGSEFGVARSPQWEAESRAYRKEQPLCEFGMHKPTLLNPLNTHHVKMFSKFPEEELKKSNWMNVCRFHHYGHCHLFNWKDSNPQCREDAKAFTVELITHRQNNPL